MLNRSVHARRGGGGSFQWQEAPPLRTPAFGGAKMQV